MRTRYRSLLATARLAAFGAHPIASALNRLCRALPEIGTGTAVPDVVFVTPPASAMGWILGAICHEIASRLPDVNVSFCHADQPLPRARRYFFSHYMYFVDAQAMFSNVRRGQSYVFATHLEPDKHRIDSNLLARLLGCSDGVICMNSNLREDLINHGAPAHKLHTLIGGADRKIYQPHPRQPDGKVGFCSRLVKRKSPDLVLDIVRKLPHRRFVLLGRDWQQYTRFEELLMQPNFEYVDTPYSNYPDWYAQMSVFVSVSELEGGPIPLLEAMMSNVVPVASRTGFAPDVITHGENGYLFDVGASSEQICPLIEQAFTSNINTHETVQHCDWNEFTSKLAAMMGLAGPLHPGNQTSWTGSTDSTTRHAE